MTTEFMDREIEKAEKIAYSMGCSSIDEALEKLRAEDRHKAEAGASA